MYIVTASEMYEIDRVAIEEKGLDGRILMENAGQAVTAQIKRHINQSDTIVLLVGSGNNGGDGFVIARYLLNQGYSVKVIQLVADQKLSSDASYHKQIWINFGGDVLLLTEIEDINVELEAASIIIDAMLGIGVNGALRSPFKEVVQAVNDSSTMVISIDLPSGLPADGGADEFIAVQSNYTYIIEAPKTSTFIASYASFYGEWTVVPIGLPTTTIKSLTNKRLWQAKDVRATLPNRSPFSHKGTHGKAIIVGGSMEMPGSITMTAKAALRSGAGLLTVATIPEVFTSIASQCTETTFHRLTGENGVITQQAIDLSGYTACAIGMGMGRSEQSRTFTLQLLEAASIPVIIDADGLDHIRNSLRMLAERQAPTILTPHPGEMARLLGCSVAEVVANSFDVAKQFAKTYRVYLVLKGATSIFTTPEGKQFVNMTGNAGLAKGGSGDTLTGIILAMLMQHQSVEAAIANSCFIHGAAADLLIKTNHSTYDLLATDVINALPSVFRTFLD